MKLYMRHHGSNRIEVIKVLREYLGLGLKEAKDMSEASGLIFQDFEVNSSNSSLLVNLERALKRAGADVYTSADVYTGADVDNSNASQDSKVVYIISREGKLISATLHQELAMPYVIDPNYVVTCVPILGQGA